MAICEDAPCCGCCGTNIYGVYQGEGSYYDEQPDFDDSAYDDYDDEPEDDTEYTREDYYPEDAMMEIGLFGGEC